MSDAVTMSGDISQNGSAIAFKSGSSVALYDALVALGATFLDTMGRQARTWFVRHHQEKDVLKLFEKTYQEAVAKRVTQR
jgi:hypothetical protein